MMGTLRFCLWLAACLWLLGSLDVQASDRHVWSITSPDHEQTFTYGTEQSRVWATRGHDRHLAVLLNFTNDPYVGWSEPRQYDNFTFNFPSVTMGKDGRTYYFHAPNGRAIPVATKWNDFFGVDETKLLPNAKLVVEKPHGYLTLTIVVMDLPSK